MTVASVYKIICLTILREILLIKKVICVTL
jgi:hypothetical protein